MSRIEDAVAAINAMSAYEGLYAFPLIRGKRRLNVIRATELLRSRRIAPEDVMHNVEISRQVAALHDANRRAVAELLDTRRMIVPADARAKPCRPKLQVVR